MITESQTDRWIQRAAVFALWALAALLLTIGIVLYAPSAHGTPTPNIDDNSTVLIER
jgi:hypothetical protein